MEIGSNQVVAGDKKRRRSNSIGIRIVGTRVYDSANGKTCHQCRQKTMDFSAACKNIKKGKPCPIRFCHKCLLNRYGEIAEDVEDLAEWTCPKCRDICNCSICEKKHGRKPTGQLIRMAKAYGFNSVSEMLSASRAADKSGDIESNKVNDIVLPSKESNLEKKRGRNSSSAKVVKSKAVSPMKQIASDKELVVLLSGELGKENSSDVKSDLKLDPLNGQKASLCKMSKKTKREELKEISNEDNVDGARKKKSLKRPKICKEVPRKETKGNTNDETKDNNKVSKKGTKVDSNHDTDRPASGLQTQANKNNCNDFGDHANDILGPVTLAPQDYLFNPKYHDNAGAKLQEGIARFPNDGVNREIEKIEEEIPLPPGTEITEILDSEFPPEEVGNALQLLEFCRVFGKAIDLKKGEAEAILRELIRKRTLRRGQNTLVVQFQIRVLTLILIDSGNESPSLTTNNGSNSWLKPLEDLITESNVVLKDFPLDWLREGINGYNNLDLSSKLSLLNFLCDEALGTEKLRSYIEDENSRRAVDVKEAKSKVAAAKEKEKGLREKLQKEMAKAFMPNVSPFPTEKHHALLTKIKTEMAQAHAEMLELKGTIPKENNSSDAMRIKPEFVDFNGHAFWKLRSYNGDAILLQDIKIQDETATASEEKWFVYGHEKKDEVYKYISSRAKRLKRHKVSNMLYSEANP
ncbi:uncharacterized protein LOC109814014 isoform X2 [Cajanus cajan]|uniref:uncharacterized protein LOC109814014 isoform X2 n=1 Tax=Cajanus cajan TaxID=3821 RepID=UPI00098DAE3A|nr:uncharacterized protein LOC109814014 isoform X2 [Cajanus cajan]